MTRQQKIAQKYQSVDSLDKHSKIEALSDTKLNPYRLSNPYDSLNNSLNRWKIVAQNASSMSSEDKEKVAKNYYRKMIAPFYGAMSEKGISVEPLSEELWMKSAYGEALKYDLKDSYDWSITHGLKRGYDSGSAAVGRAGELLTNVLGYALKSQFDIWRETGKSLTGTQSWHDSFSKIHNEVSKGGFFQTAKDETAKIPLLAQISRIAHDGTKGLDFWGQVLPNTDFTSKATSFVSEQAMQLPLYAAMGAGNKILGSLAGTTNLTKTLFATTLGKRVFGYLMAGTEGLAYGVATRPQEDKTQAWRDAIGFSIFHGIFDVGGLGLKKAIDLFPEGSDKFEAMKRRQDELDLAQDGKRKASGPEVYSDHKKEVANNLAVGGIPAQRAIYADALRHIENMQNVEGGRWTPSQVRLYEQELLNDDPARWGPVLSSAKFIRSLLEDRRLSDIKPGSEEEKFLSSRLSKPIVDAGSEMNQHVEGLKEETQAKIAETVKTPEGKKTLEFYLAKVSAQISKADPAALKMMKPEQLQKLAQKAMAEDAQKAAEIAEKKLKEDSVKEAETIAKRRKDVDTAAKKTAPVKTRSEYKEDKWGQPSARYQAEPDYKIRLAAYTKEAESKNQTLEQFFHDMDDEDFGRDLSQHFYPEGLRKAEVFFEHQGTREGTQNPNFLAFMYNYTKQMPEEFGKELEHRLIETTKVQKYMNGKKPTEPQLEYFAKAMYNHVDNFLDSGRWPKELNIFRSSNEKMFESTRWQMQLLRERVSQERKNLRQMFSGKPKQLRAAMNAYENLRKARAKEHAIGPTDLLSQHRIKDINEDITDIFTSTGSRERIPF